MRIKHLLISLSTALCTTLLLGLVQPAHSLVLLPGQTGYLEQRTTIGGTTLAHDPTLTDLLVSSGGCCGIGFVSITRHAYAWFAIDAKLGQPLEAVLRFEITPPGFPGQVALFDIQSAPAAFQSSFSGPPTQAGLDLMSDLGSGVGYGLRQLDPGQPLVLSFTLPQAALESLAAARGGQFGVGFTGTAALIGILNSPLALSDVSLTISAVPEPAPAATTLLGLIGLAALLTWRRRDRIGLRRAAQPFASPALISSGLTLLK